MLKQQRTKSRMGCSARTCDCGGQVSSYFLFIQPVIIIHGVRFQIPVFQLALYWATLMQFGDWLTVELRIGCYPVLPMEPSSCGTLRRSCLASTLLTPREVRVRQYPLVQNSWHLFSLELCMKSQGVQIHGCFNQVIVGPLDTQYTCTNVGLFII